MSDKQKTVFDFDNVAMDVFTPLPREDVAIDPVKYEIAVHRINAILREGSFALARTSGSPIVTECGEYMFAIYDADGHAAYVTAGVLSHLTGTEGGVKLIRQFFEGDINPEDQFVINEPYALGIHTPDVLIVKPVFHNDSLVAWIGSLTHSAEIGAKDPGGCADSTDIFQEGIRVPGMKIVDRGTPNKAAFRLLERSVRDPQLMGLDLVAKIAGNNVAETRLQDLLGREGPDFLVALLKKMIYESEDRSRARIRLIPDGDWHARAYGDHTGKEHRPVWADVVCRKRGDRMQFDLSGSSPQNPGPANSLLPGTIGSIFAVLVSTLFWDMIWNRGIVSQVEVIAPQGTMYNPIYPAPCFAAPGTAVTLLGGPVTAVVSEMAMAAGISETVCAPWMSNVMAPFIGGRDQYGRLGGTVIFDTNGAGTGGTSWMDGADTSDYMQAPGAVMGDVESYESKYPILYLFRRQRVDSSGHGKFKGGCGGESAIAIHGSPTYSAGFRGNGKLSASSPGIFGGYPAKSLDTAFVRNPGIFSLTTDEYREVVDSAEKLKAIGQTQILQSLHPSSLLDEGDIFYYSWSGGGGYGDPIKRDPRLVEKDVRSRRLSVEIARAIYGVVLDPSTGELDEAATQDLRATVVSQRSIGCALPSPSNNPAPAAKSTPDRLRIHESLVVTSSNGKSAIQCVECGQVICGAGEDYHEHLASRTRDPHEVGHHGVNGTWFVYREYYCPRCWTLMSVEPSRVEDMEVWDARIIV